MVQSSLCNLLARSLSATSSARHQHQQLRRLNIHEYQGAELMGNYGMNLPKGCAVSTLEEVRAAICAKFAGKDEVSPPAFLCFS